MPLSPEEQLERRSRLGASEAAAVLGLDPWMSPWDVWARKVIGVERDEINEPIEIGHMVEDGLVQWAAESYGLDHIEMQPRRRRAFWTVKPDAHAPNERVNIEAKSTSQADRWGREGTDEVPDRVIVQAHVQMLVFDARLTLVPVLTSRYDRLHRALYEIPFDPQLARQVHLQCREFRIRHVLARLPPTNAAPSMRVLERLKRVPVKAVAVDEELIRAFERARDERLEWQKREKAAKAKLIAALGDGDHCPAGDGVHVWWYDTIKQRRFDEAAFKAEHPKLFEAFRRETEYRKLTRNKRLGRTLSLEAAQPNEGDDE